MLDIGMCRGYDESIEHRREKNHGKRKKTSEHEIVSDNSRAIAKGA